MRSSANLNSAFQKTRSISAYGGPETTRFPAHRAVVNSHSSEWCRNLEARFNELTSLPRGWDGYVGRPVSFTCAEFAAKLLERIFIDGVAEPSLVPGGDGTLQIEWHKNQFDIEIDVLAANNVIASRYDHITGREDLIEMQNDFALIVEWVEELMEREHLETANP